jgi:hypothetical protein
LKNKTTFVISCAVLALDLKRAAKDMGICNADTVFFRRSTPEELSEASDSSQFLISFLRYGRDVGWRTVFTCISIVSDGDSPIFSNSAIHAPIPSEFSALPIRFARQSFRVLFVTIRKRVFSGATSPFTNAWSQMDSVFHKSVDLSPKGFASSWFECLSCSWVLPRCIMSRNTYPACMKLLFQSE